MGEKGYSLFSFLHSYLTSPFLFSSRYGCFHSFVYSLGNHSSHCLFFCLSFQLSDFSFRLHVSPPMHTYNSFLQFFAISTRTSCQPFFLFLCPHMLCSHLCCHHPLLFSHFSLSLLCTIISVVATQPAFELARLPLVPENVA